MSSTSKRPAIGLPIARRLAFALALLLGFMVPSSAQAPLKEPPAGTLETAANKARENLAAFEKRLADPGPAKNFTLRLRYETIAIGRYEDVWAGDVKREGGKLTAAIVDAPRDVPNLKAGQRVDVTPDTIVDWGYIQNEKMHGYYSIRALLPYMPADQAAFYKKLLAPLD